MDKNYVLDNFDFVLDKMAWTKVLSWQKDEAKVLCLCLLLRQIFFVPDEINFFFKKNVTHDKKFVLRLVHLLGQNIFCPEQN